MTMRKAVYEVACDTNGMGYDDVHLRPSIDSRKAKVSLVTLERRYSEASTGTERMGFGRPTVTLYELEDVSAESWNDSSEDYALGEQLFFADTKTNPGANAVLDEWDPRQAAVSLYGDVPTYDVLVGDVLIGTANVRAHIDGANSGDYFRVTMYYETAGDYRF